MMLIEQCVEGDASTTVQCIGCGSTLNHDDLEVGCPACGSPTDFGLGPSIEPSQIIGKDRSMWRYRAALRIRPGEAGLGEGRTPLVHASYAGAPVLLKLDYVMPSGSFKDRGIAALVAHLAGRGVRRITEDSSGNAAASLALYAARAGIECRIFVPQGASPAKLAAVKAARATLIEVPGTRDMVAEEARNTRKGELYAGHNWQPSYLEGLRTLGYEIWEDLDFDVPDNIVMPVGGGSSLLGCARPFAELFRDGRVGKRPRIFGVQAANCAPIHARFQDTAPTFKPTIAEGIALQRPARINTIIAAVAESGGEVVAVDEAQITDATRNAAKSGFFIEPTSAAALAGFSSLLNDKKIDRKERTVVLLTGSGMKATGFWNTENA